MLTTFSKSTRPSPALTLLGVLIVLAANRCSASAATAQSTPIQNTGSPTSDETQPAPQYSTVTRNDGVIVAIEPGKISVRFSADAHGEPFVEHLQVQSERQRGIDIGGRVINAPAKIKVFGQLPARLAEKGMLLSFKTRLSFNGKSESPVQQFRKLHANATDPNSKLRVDFLERPVDASDFGDCQIVGRVITAGANLVLAVPESRWARNGRLSVPFNDTSQLQLEETHLRNVRPGDRVKRLKYYRLNSGQKIVNAILVSLNPDRNRLTLQYFDRLQQQFAHYSNREGPPRTISSDHFILHTDASDRDAQVLLAKLETMYGLLAKYFARRPQHPIECYVVADLNRWASGQFRPNIKTLIAQGSGATHTNQTIIRSQPNRPTVYACRDHGIVQHEAVHAFCIQTFGGLGPVWYAEGLAEIGRYYQPDTNGVKIDPVILKYLKSSPPRTVAEIISDDQVTGDSWEKYAWRWAVCHFLSTNPNYTRRFKGLGKQLMQAGKADHPQKESPKQSTGQEKFDRAFVRQRAELDFEFAQFVKNLENGMSAKLNRLQWGRTPTSIADKRWIQQEIKSNAGWQTVGLQVTAGESFELVAKGRWHVTPLAPACSADGWKPTADKDHWPRGALIGAVLARNADRYVLGEPFLIGRRNIIRPNSSGQLLLRCHENWSNLEDNAGTLKVTIRKAKNKANDDQAGTE